MAKGLECELCLTNICITYNLFGAQNEETNLVSETTEVLGREIAETIISKIENKNFLKKFEEYVTELIS